MNNIPTPSTPPLLGDGKGRYRVRVVGNSGSGKTTTGAALASILGVPFIPMDTIFWNPGWRESTAEEFQAKLRDALAKCEHGWVVDGNYDSKGSAIAIMNQATDIIWLDPPLYVYFPRIFIRTMMRLFRFGTPCSPGCDERLGEVFSKEGILWWCLSNHARCRAKNTERLRVMGVENGTDTENRKMRRFGGWGEDVRAWLKDVADMVTGGGQKAKID